MSNYFRHSEPQAKNLAASPDPSLVQDDRLRSHVTIQPNRRGLLEMERSLGQLRQKIFQTNSCHHFVWNPQLGWKIPQRLGGVEAHLGVDAAGTGGRVKLAALRIGDDDEAAVGLKAIRNRPKDPLFVEDVDVVVDDDHVLQ